MKIHILMKIIVEGYYNRYYTPMIDTGAEVNICKYNCLPDSKWIKLKTPIIVNGFNNEGSMINYKAKDNIFSTLKFISFPFTFLNTLLSNIIFAQYNYLPCSLPALLFLYFPQSSNSPISVSVSLVSSLLDIS